MRLLRTVSWFAMPCGCVGGVYECYDGRVVHLIDALAIGRACGHRVGMLVNPDTLDEPPSASVRHDERHSPRA